MAQRIYYVNVKVGVWAEDADKAKGSISVYLATEYKDCATFEVLNVVDGRLVAAPSAPGVSNKRGPGVFPG